MRKTLAISAVDQTNAKPAASHLSGFLEAHHSTLRIVSVISYAWLIICTASYGVTQSTSVNSYGIQPGTPIGIEILIAPAASIFYLAQFLTYGSVHVCGTFTSPCAWPRTWPGSHPLENVKVFDDIWFSMFIFAFVLFLASSRSLVKSIRAMSVAPIVLGAILFFDDNYWFYAGFSTELSRFGFVRLTNENLMILSMCCFVISTLYLKIRAARKR